MKTHSPSFFFLSSPCQELVTAFFFLILFFSYFRIISGILVEQWKSNINLIKVTKCSSDFLISFIFAISSISSLSFRVGPPHNKNDIWRIIKIKTIFRLLISKNYSLDSPKCHISGFTKHDKTECLFNLIFLIYFLLVPLWLALEMPLIPCYTQSHHHFPFFAFFDSRYEIKKFIRKESTCTLVWILLLFIFIDLIWSYLTNYVEKKEIIKFLTQLGI